MHLATVRTLKLIILLATAPLPAAAQSPSYASADSAFMAGMITHHAQAIVMSNLAPDRASNDQVKILAARVIVAQQDEITAMKTWLAKHGLPAPDTSQHQMHHGESMPGMLSQAQMDELEGARGPGFDRLFVTLMMQHHQGALTMVDNLLSTRGAAQDPFVYRVAADVHADQTAEIERMARLLLTLPLPGSNP
jgi:uncharacterized protein (DUF305 family)